MQILSKSNCHFYDEKNLIFHVGARSVKLFRGCMATSILGDIMGVVYCKNSVDMHNLLHDQKEIHFFLILNFILPFTQKIS